MFAYVEINIKGCQLPEDQCANITDIDNHYLNMYYLTSHVDFTDFVQNDAVEFDNRDKVTIILDSEVE